MTFSALSTSRGASASSPSAQRFSRSLPAEFLVAVRAAIVARSKGLKAEHYHHAKVAEAVLTAALPVLAPEIRLIAARKGASRGIGGYLGSRLDGPQAASLVALWSIRSARLAGIRAVFRTSARKPGFGDTLLKLLGESEKKRLLRRIEWRGAIED